MKKCSFLLVAWVLALASCSTQKYVSFDPPKSETFTTNKLSAFLKNTPNPTVVLRVPNAKQNAAEEDV